MLRQTGQGETSSEQDSPLPIRHCARTTTHNSACRDSTRAMLLATREMPRLRLSVCPGCLLLMGAKCANQCVMRRREGCDGLQHRRMCRSSNSTRSKRIEWDAERLKKGGRRRATPEGRCGRRRRRPARWQTSMRGRRKKRRGRAVSYGMTGGRPWVGWLQHPGSNLIQPASLLPQGLLPACWAGG
jgi:hypothetical protein